MVVCLGIYILQTYWIIQITLTFWETEVILDSNLLSIIGWSCLILCLFLEQANKEKISFGRLEVHEIAAFVLNACGNYEAINRNCSNYYLSAESVALFTDHLSSRPNYIVGQIVHIECQTVKPLSSALAPALALSGPEHNPASDTGTDRLTLNSGSTSLNPYGLPIGCEYFVVTIAMLPDTAIHSPPPTSS